MAEFEMEWGTWFAYGSKQRVDDKWFVCGESHCGDTKCAEMNMTVSQANGTKFPFYSFCLNKHLLLHTKEEWRLVATGVVDASKYLIDHKIQPFPKLSVKEMIVQAQEESKAISMGCRIFYFN
jgi:hypothetical protein